MLLYDTIEDSETKPTTRHKKEASRVDQPNTMVAVETAAEREGQKEYNKSGYYCENINRLRRRMVMVLIWRRVDERAQ